MQPLEQMRRAWTVEDLDSLGVEDWRRYQIVDGSLLVSPPPFGDHELASADLRSIVGEQLPPGLVVVGPMGIRMGRSYLIPDLVVAERARLRGLDLLAPPDVMLVVEVVSPGSVTTDRVTKPAQYAAAGIGAYWRVETDPVSLTAYTLPPGPLGVPPLAGDYAELGTWGRGQTAHIAEPFAIDIDIDLLAE